MFSQETQEKHLLSDRALNVMSYAGIVLLAGGVTWLLYDATRVMRDPTYFGFIYGMVLFTIGISLCCISYCLESDRGLLDNPR